jgi:cytochrome d ubiquinol oxidase subunit I
VRHALRAGVVVAAVLIPLQILAGDLHGLNTLKHQPAKVAAMEGIWEDERGAPALIFAIPNEEERRNDYAIGIPKLASLILTHELDGELKGLNSFPDAHPPVAPVFYAFRVMVGVGMLMLLAAWWSGWSLWRNGMLGVWQLRLLVGMSFSGWVATLAGWYVTEIGRQPWLVTGILRTGEAASAVPAPFIGMSLAAYLALYIALLGAYVSVLFLMARKAGAPKAAAPAASALSPEH